MITKFASLVWLLTFCVEAFAGRGSATGSGGSPIGFVIALGIALAAVLRSK